MRRNKEKMTLEEKIKISNEILESYNELINEVGRESFVFDAHDEYYIEYIWKYHNKNVEN